MDVTKISLNALSIAMIVNPYKLSDSKQYHLFSYCSVGQKYNRDLTGSKSRCWQGCVPSGALRGESVFLAFPASRSLLYLAPGLLLSFAKTAMSHVSYPSFIVRSLPKHRWENFPTFIGLMRLDWAHHLSRIIAPSQSLHPYSYLHSPFCHIM